MGTIPTVPTFTAGAVLTASDLNALGTAINFWASPPRASITKSANQSIANNTLTLITWDVEVYDTDTMHDNVTNNSRLICKTAGYYAITGAVQFSTNGTGNRITQIRQNAAGSSTGGTLLYDLTYSANSGNATTVVIPGFTVALAVNDYIEAFGQQTSGGALNVNANSNNSFLSMQLVGKV